MAAFRQEFEMGKTVSMKFDPDDEEEQAAAHFIMSALSDGMKERGELPKDEDDGAPDLDQAVDVQDRQ